PGSSPVAAHRALGAGQRAALARTGRQLATGPVPVPDECPAERPAGGRPARGHDVPPPGARLRSPRPVPAARGGRDCDRDTHAPPAGTSPRGRTPEPPAPH